MPRISNYSQFKIVFDNIFLLAYRSKELLVEILFPFISGCVMLIKNLLVGLSFLAPIMVPLAINGSTRSLLIRLVEEKSGRFKETQKIMGLRQTPYFMAWYASSILRTLLGGFIFVLIPIAIATKNGFPYNVQMDQAQKYIGFWEIYNQGDVPKFVLLYFLYVFAAVHQSFALSTFFSSPKLAGEVGTFITTVTTLLVFLVYYGAFCKSSVGFILLGIFPQAGMGFGYITASESYAFPQLKKYSVNAAIVQMAVMAVVYLILYFYLEQVMPNEYGISKHPLFCLQRKNKHEVNQSRMNVSELVESGIEKKKKKSGDLEQQLLKYQQNDDEDVSSAIYHQEYAGRKDRKRTVEIGRLTKYFGDLKAVNNVSLSLYEKNIFCLLGHNGAGKTTMISLLTGLISKSQGNVKLYGKDLEDDLEEIRANLGICNQRDVLYEELTFEEHLKFIASIKGVLDENMEQEIDIILDKTKCQGERKKVVKELSGGNKRKLSLAMALIGGSQIVFLDEPSSGMDAISRRGIWEILELVRNEERTIVLTTHHLEEAEILADRIAIMAKGKLLAVGTCDFIKRNFGVGYHLNVFPDPDSSKKYKVIPEDVGEQVKQIVEEGIPTASINPQSRKDTISFQLPFSENEHPKQFSQVFYKLEQIDGIMVNLEMNTLEDAFVNVGMDEEKFMTRKSRKSIEEVRKSFVAEKQEAKYTHFDDIYKPECLSRPPVYSFKSQFTACFLRKFYCTTRNFTNYVAFFIPLLLLIAGAIILDVIDFNDPDGEYTSEQDQNTTRLVIYSMFIALAYSFNGGIYIILPVQEREDNLKYALNVMGCKALPYWLGTFAFDFIVFFLTVCAFLAVAAIGQITFITQFAGKLSMTMFAFALSYLPYSYMCGFIFKKANSAMKGFPLFNFFIDFNLPFCFVGIVSLLYINDYINRDVWAGLGATLTVSYFFYSPFYPMLWSIYALPMAQQPDEEQGDFYYISTEYWLYIGIMIAECVWFLGVTYFLEQRQFSHKLPQDEDQLRGELQGELNEIEDEAVHKEKKRVQEISDKMAAEGVNLETENKVVVNKMWKQYDNGFVAIKDVSYTNTYGEIFGLLGPNGSGKSTSFNILTSLIPKTLGSVKVKSLDVNRGVMDIFRDVGICPQFDCIWPDLNPVEHLFLFGRMKGLYGQDLKEAVEYFIEIMQLSDFVKTKAGRLSGGNKRKLCVSDALIGGPDIQFFDEPSTGVDPIARRFLWNTLQQGAKLRNSSIILTTHTMEEAESLCTKIGILINGQFYCYGSPAELRHKYGEGYTIAIKGEEDQHEEFSKILLETFPNLKELKDKKEEFYNYRIPSNEFKFSKAFDICENLKEHKTITDFSINQSTLEEVFVYFSKYQKQDTKE